MVNFAESSLKNGGLRQDKPPASSKDKPSASSKVKSSSKVKAPEKAIKNDFNSGHRQRLRARFARAGKEGVNDYELVELMLFSALPRCDTKPLARHLLKRFSTIGSMLAAPDAQLREVAGVGDAVIHVFRLVNTLIEHTIEEKLEERVLVSNDEMLRSYCQHLLAHDDVESLWGLFLDGNIRLIKSECLQKGTINQTPVFPKEIVKRALNLSASGIILLHNHPSGDVTPSNSDVDITRKIGKMAKSMDIVLHDHIIVSRGGFNSLRSLGLYKV